MSVGIAAVAEPSSPRVGFGQVDFEEIVHSLPVGIFTCDLDGRLVEFNDRAAELWGRAPDVDAGEKYCDAMTTFALDGEAVARSRLPMAELLSTGQPVRNLGLAIGRPDGSRISIQASAEPILDGAGKLIGGLGFFHAFPGGNEERPASIPILQALPFAVYTTDAEGRITFFNETAAALWGHRPELGSSRWSGAWRLRGPDGELVALDRCPTAIAIAEDRAVEGERAIAEQPEGKLVPFIDFAVPLHDAEGKLTGVVNTLVDVADQLRLSDAGRHLAAIVECSTDAIVSKDVNGIITSWNTAAEMLFGYKAEEAIGRSILMLIPEGLQDEEASIIRRIRNGERVETFETARQHKDGHLLPVSLTISPIRDATGHIIGASKIARDITGHKENELRIRLLMREVNHRVKNQYSVILSIIRETSRRWQDPAQFERHVRERIMALSDSHDLLVLADWKGATTYELLRAQVTPFAESDRMSFSGPPVVLNPNAVQYLGIAFHELATNAAKYGALSNSTGQVEVDWQVVMEPDGSKRFELTWRETGGPPATEPTGSGFGTVVLLRVAPQAMSGSGEVVYSDGGLVWRFRAPLATIVARREP